MKSPGGSWADARKRARQGDGEGASGANDKSLNVRMVSGFEASVGLISCSMELKDLKGRNKETDSMRNILRKCGEFMTKEERDKCGRRLYETKHRGPRGSAWRFIICFNNKLECRRPSK